jgi:3-hydroxyisobutyrate dehydrogenase-like beta-hydroxyacid dehydrogenase
VGLGAVTIGILHPGEMGAAVAAQARRKGARVLWCPTGRSQATHDRARRAGLEAVSDLGELLDAAEIVLAICPPSAAQQVATQVAVAGFRGLYIEANATSPERFRRIAERLADAGAQVLDAAIFGPRPRGSATAAALYLAGRAIDIETVAMVFSGTAVEPVALGEKVGAASALQMAYTSYQRTSRVLAAVAHAIAARHGVTEQLMMEAAQVPGSPLAEPAQLASVAARAWRWTPELHEVADTLEADELPTDLALATANLLFRWHDDKDNWDLPFDALLSRLDNPT